MGQSVPSPVTACEVELKVNEPAQMCSGLASGAAHDCEAWQLPPVTKPCATPPFCEHRIPCAVESWSQTSTPAAGVMALARSVKEVQGPTPLLIKAGAVKF